MKSEEAVKDLLEHWNYQEIEIELGTKILNGQHAKGIKEALKWVLEIEGGKTK